MEKNSNELFKIAFNSASEGLVVVDKFSRILLVNNRLLELFGYTEEEILGETIERLVPMQKRKKHVAYRNEYLDHPHSRPMGKAGMLLEGEKKDGRIFPVEVSLNYFQMDGEQYVMGLVSDITKRVAMENELKNAQDNLEKLNVELESLVVKRTKDLEESQSLYKSIANNFPDGVISVVDQDLYCIYTDGAELEQLGLKQSDLIGQHFLNRFSEEARTILSDTFDEARNGDSQICEIEQKDRHYEVHIVGISISGRRRKRYLIVEINVTKQKTIEKEQAKALEKEKELGEMKSRFVSMASHEFRTPLSAILSSASLIEKYELTDQQANRKKHIDRIKSSVANLTDILNDFLSFEKLNANKVEVQLEEVNLCDLINYAVEELDSTKKAGQRIEYAGNVPDCTFWSDPKILRNILLNLLSNGLKYSGENSQVNVELNDQTDRLLLTVSDNGIGIPEKDQSNMFDRFHRAENVANIQGTGLGLNIVKKYVELLDGEITFESELGKGTSFYISLPKKNNEQK
ncbi:Sensor histidine kinase RcsC [Parvicella tangerina]|uniref:histidine kinase n=2 Tax=Parvicella tangerina TaxID=2829795 RepID=A0A916JL60_9FLAO|nr:Sensor histidine kinase RcsC [Parvicella tangerina]